MSLEIRLQTNHERDSMRAVLAAMILDEDSRIHALSMLRPDAMSGYPEGHVLRGIQSLTAESKPVDLPLLAREMAHLDVLESAGGGAFLAQIVETVPTAGLRFVERHCQIVNGEAMRRTLKAACRTTAAALEDLSTDPAEILDDAERRVLAVRDQHTSSQFETIGQVISRMGVRAQGLRLGFRRFDAKTGGIAAGNLCVIGARPGMGKTALATCMAVRVVRAGGSVKFFSLEMDPIEIAERVIALHGPTLEHVRKGGPCDDAKIQAAKLDLDVVHLPRPTLLDLKAALRRDRDRPSLVIVDYLQLVRPMGEFNTRAEAVESVAEGLKSLAMEVGVPVIALAQLNRHVEGEHGKIRRPVLSDLRESGGIEAHADLIGFLHRQHYYDPSKTEAELTIAKHRMGPIGITPLVFRAANAAFEDVAADEPGPMRGPDPDFGW